MQSHWGPVTSHHKAEQHCRIVAQPPNASASFPGVWLPASAQLHCTSLPPTRPHTHTPACLFPSFLGDFIRNKVWSAWDADARQFLANSHPVTHGLALTSLHYSDLFSRLDLLLNYESLEIKYYLIDLALQREVTLLSKAKCRLSDCDNGKFSNLSEPQFFCL